MLAVTVYPDDIVRIGDTLVRVDKDRRGRTRLIIDGPAPVEIPARLEARLEAKGYRRLTANVWVDENGERFHTKDIV